MPRLLRNPDLLIYWLAEELFVKDLQKGTRAIASADVIAILDVFSRPRHPAKAVEALEGYGAGSVNRTIRTLTRLGFLLPEEEARRRISRLKAWKSNVASAHYHVASRDGVYLQRPRQVRTYLESRVAARPIMPPFAKSSG